ncbi:nucleotide-binding universal stress UspA family protein [Winogradskyella wandonensis]|uniref:Nucleotide-binding universal stress UspA family protein n=1 Tax=Winogradskyella wandonensis TaxID=1442586 RepID=A0A4R1KJ26_9FLAO|nr:universal stress protein [Winogradskyella wandonensis]TCK64816.1 nucleotide-binding universal stress UspA family protein [Winogradskyella wandonensis]
MKKILLPTDFSDNSWNAIVYALQLFKQEDCKFYFLNTYTPVVYQIEYVPMGAAQYGLVDAIKDTAEAKMTKLLDKIKKDFKNPKHTFETITVFSTLITEIKHIAEIKGIDYIVMGTKGATGAKEVLFGSNTVQVFKNVKCPVIAVPDGFEFERPLEILFPSDYEVAFKDKHLKSILDIVKLYNSRLNIMHVSYGYDLSDKQVKNKGLLEKYFNNQAPLFHDIRNENVTDAIDKFQIKHKINLLVMLNNKHSFFENLFFKSTLSQIGFHLHIPLLVIPSQ